jgi:hypothetical protein
MDKATVFEQFSKSLLDKFIIHFVPGVIIYFGVFRLIDFRLHQGLLSFVIVACFSWVLGLVLEIIFFKKSYQLRVDNQLNSAKPIHHLLVSKVGLAILFAVLVNAFLSILDILPEPRDFHPSLILVLAIKTVVFGGLGLFLFLFFRKVPKD